MPIKTGELTYPVHDVIARRWSPIAFADRAVEHSVLSSIFEAARWASSSMNAQPWRFVVVTQEQPDDYERLLAALSDSNRRWAHTAPVLVLVVAEEQAPGSERANRYAWHDVGLAVGNMVAQATALGLYAHQMGGFSKTRARDAFDVPEGYAPVTVIALGYLGSKPPEGAYVIWARVFTAYYFLHLLVIMPIVGVTENPSPLPRSLTEAVLGKGASPVREAAPLGR